MKSWLSALVARVRAMSWEERAFVLVYATLCVVALIPLWRNRFLPLLDEPNHLSTLYVWRHINDPASRVAEFYKVAVEPLPYLLHYGIAHLAGCVAGIEAGNKLAISLYVLGLPMAALLWCLRTGRSPWLSVLTFPLSFSYAYSNGFHAYNMGAVSLLFGIVAVDAYLERPTVGRGVAATLLGVACYLGHWLPFLTFSLAVLLLWIAWRPSWRRILATGAFLLPGAACIVYMLVRPKEATWVTKGRFYEGVHLPVSEMASRWPKYVLDVVKGNLDLVVLWTLVAVFALLLAWGLGVRLLRARCEGAAGIVRRERPLLAHRGLLLLVAMTVLYFALPIHLVRPFDWFYCSGRYGTLICFFAFLLPATSLRGARALLVLPAVVVAFILPLHVSARYAAFNRRAAPLLKMVAETRPGSNILAMSMAPGSDPAVNVNCYNQLPAYVQILHGGYNPGSWDRPITFPYKLIKRLPSPPWDRQEAFNPRVHAGPYHYVIVRNEKRPIFPATETEWRRVRREGDWTFYERISRSAAP
ncbi:MAG: hypothetical protein HY906_04530 [Deltaproteobacteria bacterium]|nr:hypothetical protein [Deltaproteobacteria bacterium]